MNTDPISDLLTRIRNASMSSKDVISVPYSNLKNEISKILKAKGYITDVKTSKSGKFRELEITLADKPEPLHLKRVSKPGQRIYVKRTEIPRVLDGLGMAILSTPKGVLDDATARKEKVGGEVLCEVY